MNDPARSDKAPAASLGTAGGRLAAGNCADQGVMIAQWGGSFGGLCEQGRIGRQIGSERMRSDAELGLDRA